MPKDRLPRRSAPRNDKGGFTLIELLVVISIIAILASVGFVSYQGVRGKALESKRKADIDSIKKAYETNYDPTANNGQGGYKPLEDKDFSSGKIPTTDGQPLTSSNTYIIPASSPNPDDSLPNFAACAPLKDNVTSCPSPNQGDCSCVVSTQGTPVDPGVISVATCDNDLATGLIGYWNFDEGVGNIVTNKKDSGNGTWVGTGYWVTGKIGKAGNFGGNSYVNIPSSSAIDFATNNFTVSAWVKSTQGERVVLGKFSSGSLGYRGWGLYVYSTAGIDFFGYGSERNDVRKDATPLFDGKWRLVTGVYDFNGDSLTITSYKDGATVGTTTVTTGSLANPSAAFQIGTYMSYNPPFNGQIDDVRIYNRALSAPEVIKLYNDGNGCV